ncbi:hypothetical protein HN011_002271 [Eciton burchellii]|nr:hypothetical protein HN011_002271 [Eciton burchellii]
MYSAKKGNDVYFYRTSGKASVEVSTPEEDRMERLSAKRFPSPDIPDPRVPGTLNYYIRHPADVQTFELQTLSERSESRTEMDADGTLPAEIALRRS